jgi:hypothetical protein
MRTLLWAITIVTFITALCQNTSAGLIGDTTLSDFLAAAPSGVATSDFDSSPESTIPSGSSIGGITLTYDFGGVNVVITDGDGWSSTSDPNFLGTDDGDIFQAGDDIEFSFTARNAFGISVISLDPLLDGDLFLNLHGFHLDLSAADIQATLADGSNVWFLGVISDAPFTSIDLQAASIGQFLYNLDDIRTATIPEPGTMTLFSMGTVVLAVRTIRRRPWKAAQIPRPVARSTDRLAALPADGAVLQLISCWRGVNSRSVD